jgi:hypothetical protein
MDLTVTASAVVIAGRLASLVALGLRLRFSSRYHCHRWNVLAELASRLPPGTLLELEDNGRLRLRAVLNRDVQERHARA